MTEEENKERYKNIDFQALNAKVVNSMMEVVRLPSPEEAHTLFHKVKERFTEDELVFLTCTHIAESLKKILEKVESEFGKNNNPTNFEKFFNNLKK